MTRLLLLYVVVQRHAVRLPLFSKPKTSLCRVPPSDPPHPLRRRLSRFTFSPAPAPAAPAPAPSVLLERRSDVRQLDDLLKKQGGPLTRVINLKMDDDIVRERIGGRLLHPSSGRTYHRVFRAPQVPMKDDVTGEPLIQRADDSPALVQKRLDSFYAQTAPVVDFYERRNLVTSLDATAPVSRVYHALVEALGPRA